MAGDLVDLWAVLVAKTAGTMVEQTVERMDVSTDDWKVECWDVKMVAVRAVYLDHSKAALRGVMKVGQKECCLVACLVESLAVEKVLKKAVATALLMVEQKVVLSVGR
jgi:hypothetical protein